MLLAILRNTSLHGLAFKMYRSCLNKVRGSFLDRICGRKLSAVIQRLSTKFEMTNYFEKRRKRGNLRTALVVAADKDALAAEAHL